MNSLLGKDGVSSLLKRATDILFVQNPKGTSMGALFGVVLEGLIRIFEPAFKDSKIVNLSGTNTIYLMLFGIFVFNLPSALRRHSLDPQIEAALASIRRAKKEHNISAPQARIMYLSLYEKVLSQVVLDKDTREKVRRMERLSDKKN